jgi:Tol biopolymer transport system component
MSLSLLHRHRRAFELSKRSALLASSCALAVGGALAAGCAKSSTGDSTMMCGPGTVASGSVCIVDAPTPAPAVAALDAGAGADRPLDAAIGDASRDAAIPRPTPGLAYQLTHSVTVDPSLSPDGDKAVYITVVAGKEQLYVMNIDGTHLVQITHDDADHEDPAWSPDGGKIAFVLLAGGSEAIHLMNVDGTGVEPLTPSGVRAIHPNWSPDGKSIAYCTDDDVKPPKKNASDIFTIDLATRVAKKRITGGVNTYPSFSPDGRKLAYRKILGEMNSEIFVANVDGTGAHNVTNHVAFDGWPEWSPNGTRIVFASNRRAGYQIFVMNADGSEVKLVANTEGRATAPKWSHDGSLVYFPNCVRADFGSSCEIFVAQAPR